MVSTVKYRAGYIYHATQTGRGSVILWLCDWHDKARIAKSERAAKVAITREMARRKMS